ncbi:hypothetical protein EDD16DRAFT_948656 [Pisolithus croceorrhizus]|nr:hypothetical protein EV401DRAFT_696501 [Pisolithus croceorrhizus]KAI6119160.1 hypothetical protein EDD16DRAFT_948656 [Pisolithus croceorrhizus]KAI6160580.1 hypothetical protein EDD17DRAFT_794747 [Pisolithus thermaeus]
MDDARSRLHWASRRRTTRPEGIAYSLLGIFGVHLPIMCGESAEDALGRRLAEIISRSGDVSVLDWVGEWQSSFNSCFPANLAPYQTMPLVLLIPSDPVKRVGLDLEKARKLYSHLARLPRARCVYGRITFPSIVHPSVTTVTMKVSNPSRYTYRIHASRLMPLEVISMTNVDEDAGWNTFLFVHGIQIQAGSAHDVIWDLLDQLGQPFNALLLKRSLHNEYKRIACDCTFTACVQDTASILDIVVKR